MPFYFAYKGGGGSISISLQGFRKRSFLFLRGGGSKLDIVCVLGGGGAALLKSTADTCVLWRS